HVNKGQYPKFTQERNGMNHWGAISVHYGSEAQSRCIGGVGTVVLENASHCTNPKTSFFFIFF
ncbi:MAG: hypothetical protein O7C59_10465, partial [Rickettsia endosymbiont of Ixodes persulcatus]|nr:hypothetical protein [Rickettsia endosymbiont of Ixodes persulcatus]